MERHPNFTRTEAIHDATREGDYAPAFESLADDIIVENGPGAGPWHHATNKDDFALLLLEFASYCEDTTTTDALKSPLNRERQVFARLAPAHLVKPVCRLPEAYWACQTDLFGACNPN